MCVDVRQKISERNFNRNAFARAVFFFFKTQTLSLSLSLSLSLAKKRRTGFREDLNDDDVNDNRVLSSRGGSNAHLFLSIKKVSQPPKQTKSDRVHAQDDVNDDNKSATNERRDERENFNVPW